MWVIYLLQEKKSNIIKEKKIKFLSECEDFYDNFSAK